MKVRRLGKFAIGTISLLVFSSIQLAAADRDDKVSTLEDQMEQVGTDNYMGTFGAKSTSARPNVNGRGLLVTLDLLYWRAQVGGTEYAYTDSSLIVAFPIKGNKKNIGFKRDWGLRIGAGYNFDYDNWTACGQYTWFDTTGSGTTTAGQIDSVVPMRGSAYLPGKGNRFFQCGSAKSVCEIKYQAIDIELGRDYYISKKLSLCPNWGLKSAFIDLSQKTEYTGGSQTTQGDLQILGLEGNTVSVRESSDFSGVGPRAGLNTRWYIGEGISLFGNLTGALLWGYCDVTHKEDYSFDTDTKIRLNADRSSFSPTIQYQLGLRYDTYMHHDIHHLSVGLSFEGEYWWRQNQMLKINDAQGFKYDRYTDDLALYGLTADIKWEF